MGPTRGFALLSAAAVLLLVMTGCAPGGGADPAPELPTIAVTPVPDDEHAVSALIGFDGGSLTTTGADGTVYTLEIPADSLRSPATISMTPLTSVDGTPWGDGPSYAVQLEPSGTVLDVHGRLGIEPAVPLAADERIMFGYRGDGADLGLVLPDLESPGIVLLIEHFSGAGVKKGYLGDVEAAKQQLGGSAEQQIRNEMAAVLQGEQARADEGDGMSPESLEQIERLMERYEKEVVQIRLKAAENSCAAARSAVDTILGYERQRQLLGMAEGGLDMAGLLDLARPCVEEEFEICQEQHVVHRMIPIWLAIERQAQLLGSETSAVADLARQRTEDCLRFELEFTSDGRGSGEEGLITSSVEATVPFRFNAAEVDFEYEQQVLRNTAYSATYEGSTAAGECSIKNSTGDGAFTPIKLWWDFDWAKDAAGKEGGLDAGMGEVTAVHLVWVPQQTTESTTVVCPEFSLPMYRNVWSNSFWGAGHFEKEYRSDPEGYWIDGWELPGGEVWATKEYSTSTTVEGITLEDSSSFILRHVPQKSG